MAPPNGPRGGSSGPRSSPRTSTTRGGGISKRRSTARTDRDGDVSMAPAAGGAPTGPSARGSGRSRASRAPRSSRLSQNIRNHIADKTTLKILGLKSSKAVNNKDGGLRNLLDFIERKSKDKNIVLSRGIIDGDYVWIKVNKEDAPVIMRLNGFTYAGASLTIEETNEPMPTAASKVSREAAETKAKLLSVLSSRYNDVGKILDLSALGADPVLGNLGTFDSQSLAQKSFRALVHLVGSEYRSPEEKREAIPAVSLARNDITDVDQVFTLAYSLPHLRRLDLTGNKLDNFSALSKWKHEFRHLEELHLTGNPVSTQPNYVAEIMNWFPSLQILDGQQVRTPAEAAEAMRAANPQPIPEFPSNLRDGDAGIAGAFIGAFFDLYDRDRAALASQFYDMESTFSLTAPDNNSRDHSWRAYTQYSRNLQKLGPRNQLGVDRLYVGGPQIAQVWTKLPVTRHPPLSEGDAWLVDCHTFNGLADPTNSSLPAMGLMINIHASFEEADAAHNHFGVRKFSRNFILGPSMPGAPHPYRVISDQFTLHGWKPQAVASVAAPVAAPAAAPAAVPVAAATSAPVVAPAAPVIAPVIAPVPTQISPGAASIDDATKAQMIQELSRLTGMTSEYSQLCLSGAADWNWDMALKSFEELKAALPAEAFSAS